LTSIIIHQEAGFTGFGSLHSWLGPRARLVKALVNGPEGTFFYIDECKTQLGELTDKMKNSTLSQVRRLEESESVGYQGLCPVGPLKEEVSNFDVYLGCG
jgi:hypothetical protein